ncbi:hypothetical protein N7492_000815 [Penicillium capsulatum]|uniref:BHLH domain-containing protein n=1 Tax=Penicillium capsulatum TaxID=69766 RepID=A0A9W9ISJ4_9EURO|nr:hypothetical protein N7492_000815 [Penicillium capsulatum]KAJ6130126.1 hypothetical protein N7512_002906 [Penicillium capsulatum]
MEQRPAMSWPEQLHENSLMTGSGEDEFSNFLEFNMHFPDLEGHGPAHSQLPEQQQSMVQPTTTAAASATLSADLRSMSYATPMEGLAMDFSPGTVSSQGAPMPYSTPSMTPGFCAQDASHQAMSQQPQPPSGHNYMQGQTMIPPTPNSMELHGNAARYPQRVDDNQEMYDRYSRINEEQALYTPLVSPAMTPLENQFRLPEYTIPGEYFTPLTSPALEAQNANTSQNGYQYPSRQVSDVGLNSTHAEVSPLPGTSAPPSPNVVRKPNRRRPSTAPRYPARSKVKQSPSIRAQVQRRGKPVPNSDEFYNSLSEELSKPQNNDVRSLQASSTEGSGQDSVSPEPLSEPLMPPPALPPPRKSPAIAPQLSQSPGSAATPATLMRIQRSQLAHAQDSPDQFTGQAQLDYHDEIMEDIALPEAATPSAQPRPQVSRMETSVHVGTASPALSANVTPSLEPRLAPADQTPGSAVAPSPRTVAMPSPSGPVPKRSDPSRASISSRKRPSVSSTQASPQLRPKISPSIQPLMRSGDNLSSDALYLASKSNYQHILDGTLPSGVSYPETLAENLSSKRTNHKLAEQGRRNRINSALKEIETLIPLDFVQARQAKEAALTGVKPADKEKEKSSNQAISKASAVEMAIDYIKALKLSLDQTTAKLAATEAKLAAADKNDTPAEAVKTPNNTSGEKSETKSQ